MVARLVAWLVASKPIQLPALELSCFGASIPEDPGISIEDSSENISQAIGKLVEGREWRGLRVREGEWKGVERDGEKPG